MQIKINQLSKSVTMIVILSCSFGCSSEEKKFTGASKHEAAADAKVDLEPTKNEPMKGLEESTTLKIDEVKDVNALFNADIIRCQVEDESILKIIKQDGCRIEGIREGDTKITVVDVNDIEHVVAGKVLTTQEAETTAQKGIDVDDEQAKLHAVKSVTGKLRYDGKANFCVNFKKGEVSIQSQASRVNSYIKVDFTVVTNKKRQKHTWTDRNPGQNLKLPGDWSFVQSASLQLANPVRCTDDRAKRPPIISQQRVGNKICLSMDDSDRKQSGQMCYDMIFNIVPK